MHLSDVPFCKMLMTNSLFRLILAIKAADERLDHQYLFIYLKRMHEVRRMIATLREIFMSKLCSIKSLVYASLIARAFNRVAGNIVNFKNC